MRCKNRIVNLISAAAAVAVLFVPATASAGEREDALIARVVEAYGKTRLENLRTLRLNTTRAAMSTGQGYTSDYVQFDEQERIFLFDLGGGRGSVETINRSNNGVFHGRNSFDGKNGYAINYGNGTFSQLPSLAAAMSGVTRTVDPLIARELAQQSETAQYLGEAYSNGRPHEAISYTQPDGNTVLTLKIDADTGLISEMARDISVGKFFYRFYDQRPTGGIIFAHRLDLYVNKDLLTTVTEREFIVNPRFSGNTFGLDRGIREDTAERIDVSELTYRRISDSIGHVGQGGAFSVFVDAGDYLIGVGGYPGLKDRLAKFREETGNKKILRYQVVSHHHTDHLGGMADAYEIGTVFVVHPAALDNLKEAIGDDLPDDRLMIVEDRATLGGGAVEVYDITTSHAEHLLLTYATEAKAIFMADHFGSPYVEYVPPAGSNGVRLHQAIKDLELDVDILLAAHQPGARSWAQFEVAVAAYDPSPCKFNRPICQ